MSPRMSMNVSRDSPQLSKKCLFVCQERLFFSYFAILLSKIMLGIVGMDSNRQFNVLLSVLGEKIPLRLFLLGSKLFCSRTYFMGEVTVVETN